HEQAEHQGHPRQHACESLRREARAMDLRPREGAAGLRDGAAGSARVPAAVLRGGLAAGPRERQLHESRRRSLAREDPRGRRLRDLLAGVQPRLPGRAEERARLRLLRVEPQSRRVRELGRRRRHTRRRAAAPRRGRARHGADPLGGPHTEPLVREGHERHRHRAEPPERGGIARQPRLVVPGVEERPRGDRRLRSSARGRAGSDVRAERPFAIFEQSESAAARTPCRPLWLQKKQMNARLVVGLGAAALGILLGPSAFAQFGSEPASLELIELNDDMYVISNPAVPGLVTVLVTDEGVLLVDDKFEVDHENIMALLRTVTDQPVKYVINTHYHGDHSGGNAKLQALDAIAVASDEARARMVALNQPGQPNITVSERATIHIGGKTVEIHKV